jgi:hypothetical protein
MKGETLSGFLLEFEEPCQGKKAADRVGPLTKNPVRAKKPLTGLGRGKGRLSTASLFFVGLFPLFSL